MQSFASINGLDGLFAICDVELVGLEKGRTASFVTNSTKSMSFPVTKFPVPPAKGDIFIVNHDGEKITSVLCRDDFETQRRRGIIGKLISRYET